MVRDVGRLKMSGCVLKFYIVFSMQNPDWTSKV